MKRTYQPSKRRKARKHGFFSKSRAILRRKRAKGRKKIT